MAEYGYEVISEKEIEEMKREIDASGVKDIDVYLQGKITEWQGTSINIALVGESCVGKSSFINKIRDRIEGDSDYAEVGLGDTTKVPTPYKHPHNDKMVFWDLPGVGTTTFPKDRYYFERVKFDRYDFFLILSDQSFSENDTWLAKEIRKRGKNFYFVRTKLDIELQRAEHDDTSKDEVIPRIHEACRCNFRAARIKEPPLFVMSNFDHEIGQFDDLISAIFWSLPEIKRKAMILSVGPLTHQIIRDKKNALKSRALKVACLSAGVAAIPIPGLDIAFDIGALVNEVNFYMETFGLDEGSLRHLAAKTGTPLKVIINSLKQGKKILSFRRRLKTFIMEQIRDQAAQHATSEFAKYIPIIGTIVSSTVTFGTSYYLLCKIVDGLEKDAHNIIDIVICSAAKTAT